MSVTSHRKWNHDRKPTSISPNRFQIKYRTEKHRREVSSGIIHWMCWSVSVLLPWLVLVRQLMTVGSFVKLNYNTQRPRVPWKLAFLGPLAKDEADIWMSCAEYFQLFFPPQFQIQYKHVQKWNSILFLMCSVHSVMCGPSDSNFSTTTVESDFLSVFSTSLLGQQSGSETSEYKTMISWWSLLCLQNVSTLHAVKQFSEKVSDLCHLKWTGTFCFVLDTTEPIK